MNKEKNPLIGIALGTCGLLLGVAALAYESLFIGVGWIIIGFIQTAVSSIDFLNRRRDESKNVKV